MLNLKKIKEPFLFIFPVLSFIFIFILIPVLGTLLNSLFKDIAFLPKQFIFLANYRELFQAPGFWQSFGFTLLFVMISVPIEICLGLFFALLLNEHFPGRSVLRACILIPWAIPAAISGRIWELIYNYNYGLGNFILAKLHLTSGPVNWLGSQLGAFCSLVMADAWKTVPFVTIILMAGLTAVPEEIQEQAKLDGATLAQRFFKITLPLLKPVLIVALLFRTIDGLRIFDLIYVLTHGGPGGSTNSLSMYGYKYFLASDFGYGSAVSVILFIIALILAIFYVRLGKFHEDIS